MTTTLEAPVAAAPEAGPPAIRRRRAGVFSQIVVLVLAVLWILPILWAIYTSFRPQSDTNKYGYASIARSLTLDNYKSAWTDGQMLHFFRNSLLITAPAVVITLALASSVAFVVSRLGLKFNLTLLILFTAGNLLPQQVLIAPLYKLYNAIHVPEWISDSGRLYDSQFGVSLINIAFQTGFCVFVLSNFMKSIPEEIGEAARVDGAGVWTQFWRLTLPLCRPPLAALATLLTTWIYNDFFWGTQLMSTGDKFPVTSAIANLKGQFATNANLLSAGALLIAVPTLVVYLLLQRQFVAGLTLGSTKG